MTILRKKICLLGSFSVGKSSLIRRFVHGTFDETYMSTIGVNISQKRIESSDPKKSEYEFFIWDIEGHEKFSEVIESYYAGAAGALLVCDLSRPDSLDQLDSIAKRFLKINPGAALVCCGNKIDLIDNTHPQIEKVKNWVGNQKIELFLTSAKEATAVDEAFQKLAHLL